MNAVTTTKVCRLTNWREGYADMGPRYREALGAAGPWAAGLRPAPTVWSALEYACHMRDVLLVQRDRAVVALVEDNPGFARMYRDERVELCRLLRRAARGRPRRTGDVGPPVRHGVRRPRAGRLGSPARLQPPQCREHGPHNVAWLARHTVHEGEHHLMDVKRALASAGQG